MRERRRIISSFVRLRNYYQVEKELTIPRATIRYWVSKYMDAQYHNKPIGGNRNSYCGFILKC